MMLKMKSKFLRLSRKNEKAVDEILRASKNPDLNVNWVGNVAVEKGVRFARRRFVRQEAKPA